MSTRNEFTDASTSNHPSIQPIAAQSNNIPRPSRSPDALQHSQGSPDSPNFPEYNLQSQPPANDQNVAKDPLMWFLGDQFSPLGDQYFLDLSLDLDHPVLSDPPFKAT